MPENNNKWQFICSKQEGWSWVLALSYQKSNGHYFVVKTIVSFPALVQWDSNAQYNNGR